jgi:hypothetical protein
LMSRSRSGSCAPQSTLFPLDFGCPPARSSARPSSQLVRRSSRAV